MGKIRVEQAALGALATNCYFLYQEDTDSTLIIDPADSADLIINRCILEGRKPEAILLTHGHYDHMLAADAVRKKFGIPIYAAEAEKELLGNAAWNLSSVWAEPVTLKADRFLKDGDELSLAGMKLSVIGAPGHTKGGLCYYLPEEHMLFSGDTLFSGSYGRTDFPTSSMRELADTIRRRLLVLPEETIVYPGHGESTQIGYEKRYNPLA